MKTIEIIAAVCFFYVIFILLWKGFWDMTEPPQPPKKKKPYTKPVLTVYGNIREMTETSTMGLRRDAHGMRSTHKTA